ncbi:unnamed protein product [Triticum turgidum subsp. durum]|nr:unnamed protein product [Triticum turgidum subsp. durum]
MPPPPSSMAPSALPSRTFHRRHPLPSPAPPPPPPSTVPCCVSRRRAAAQLLLSAGLLTAVSSSSPPALAARRGRRTIAPEDYASTPDGLKYYDLIEGKGPTAEKGSTVQVHFDCIYRSITVVSSREAKLLAGNRSIAQ